MMGQIEKTNFGAFGPSKFSAEGFMGNDTRPVQQIIEQDALVLKTHRISIEKLVSALSDVFTKAKNALGVPIQLGPTTTAVYHESMGKIPSPFTGEGLFEKGEVVITDTNSNRQIIITKLGIHLIEKHGFFQGIGCRYRIDPLEAASILGI